MSHVPNSRFYCYQIAIKPLSNFINTMSAVTEQVIALSSQNECPICMDTIEGLCNRVVTECGHAFHCSCLMQNAAHNGFGCPYCRTKMADEPEEEEDDEDDVDSIEEETVFDSDALTSFRMFHQQINGEEVEEEEAEEWETVDGDEDEDDEEPASPRPDAAYMAQKLAARGITFEDLVKNIMFQEHGNFGEHFIEYERRSSEVYGQFRAVISQYTPQEAVAATEAAPTPQQEPQVTTQVTPIILPIVAESKSAAIPRRREFLVHV